MAETNLPVDYSFPGFNVPFRKLQGIDGTLLDRQFYNLLMSDLAHQQINNYMFSSSTNFDGDPEISSLFAGILDNEIRNSTIYLWNPSDRRYYRIIEPIKYDVERAQFKTRIGNE